MNKFNLQIIMSKRKKYIIIFILLLALVIVVVRVNKKSRINDYQKIDNQSQVQQVQDNLSAKRNENFEQANLSDLIIGEKILAVGIENDDGSVSANQIIISDNATDFENIIESMQPPINNGSTNLNDNNQSSTGFSGERPSPEQMQAMSKEERMEMIEKIKAQKEANGMGNASNTEESPLRLIGEIIDQDELIIILKLEAGGSRLVFLSENSNYYRKTNITN